MTQTRSRGLNGNIEEEAMTQTTDAVSGSESVPSRSGMNKQQSWRSDLKELLVDPPNVDEDGGSVTEKASELAIWRSRLRPRNTGMVAWLKSREL